MPSIYTVKSIKNNNKSRSAVKKKNDYLCFDLIIINRNVTGNHNSNKIKTRLIMAINYNIKLSF